MMDNSRNNLIETDVYRGIHSYSKNDTLDEHSENLYRRERKNSHSRNNIVKGNGTRSASHQYNHRKIDSSFRRDERTESGRSRSVSSIGSTESRYRRYSKNSRREHFRTRGRHEDTRRHHYEHFRGRSRERHMRRSPSDGPSRRRNASYEIDHRSTSDISDGEYDDFDGVSSYPDRKISTRSSSSGFSAASNFVVIQNVASACTEEQLEERIRAISIQKGFSLPNTVILEKDDSMHGSGRNASSASTGYVEFPSIEAASRFIKVCGKKGTLFIANRHCAVDFAPVDAVQKYSGSLLNASLSSISTKNDQLFHRDWTCPKCRYLNFARRTSCGSCAAPRVVECARITPASTIKDLVPNFQSSAEPSSWIILKDLHIAVTEQNILNELAGLNCRKITLMQPNSSDKNGAGGRGFCFCEFDLPSSASQVLKALQSSVSLFGSKCIRCESVSKREKQAFLDMLKMANLPDESKATFHDLERVSTISNSSPFWREYVLQWTARSIFVFDGPPDVSNFVFDSASGYLYDSNLCLFYDPSTQYYMNSNGDYYVWESHSSSLRRVYSLNQRSDDSENALISDQKANFLLSGQTLTDIPVQDMNLPVLEEVDANFSLEQTRQGTSDSVIASLLAVAHQTAKASKDTVKVLEALGTSNDKKTALTSKIAVPNNSGFSSGSIKNLEKDSTDALTASETESCVFGGAEVANSYNSEDISTGKEKMNYLINSSGNQPILHVYSGTRSSMMASRSEKFSNAFVNSTADRDESLCSGVIPLFTDQFEQNKLKQPASYSSANLFELQAASSKNEKSNYICFVCMRRFKTHELLERHEKLSRLHQSNLKIITV